MRCRPRRMCTTANRRMSRSASSISEISTCIPYGYAIIGYASGRKEEKLESALSSHTEASFLIAVYNRFRFSCHSAVSRRGVVDVSVSDGSSVEVHSATSAPSWYKDHCWVRIAYPLQCRIPSSSSREERIRIVSDTLDKEPFVLTGGCVIDASTTTPVSELPRVQTEDPVPMYLNLPKWMDSVRTLEAADIVSQFTPAEDVSKSDQRVCGPPSFQ